MIVVADTSPFINLAAVGRLHLLNKLYGSISIPRGVHQEITGKGSGQAGSKEAETLKWIEVKTVSDQKLVKALSRELDKGESEAIVLAIELSADLLLMDERRGRVVARDFDLRYSGLLGVLIEAKQKGYIKTVKPLLDDLRTVAGFWISQPLYEYILGRVDIQPVNVDLRVIRCRSRRPDNGT